MSFNSSSLLLEMAAEISHSNGYCTHFNSVLKDGELLEKLILVINLIG